MTVDDQRNTLIVEIAGQTGLGSKLQGLRNMDLVRIALGQDPAALFKPLPGPLQQLPRDPYVFNIGSFEMKTQKSDTIIATAIGCPSSVTILDSVTKDARILPPKTLQIGGSIKSRRHHERHFCKRSNRCQGRRPCDGHACANQPWIKQRWRPVRSGRPASRQSGWNSRAPCGAVIGSIFGDTQKGTEVGQEIAKGVGFSHKAA